MPHPVYRLDSINDALAFIIVVFAGRTVGVLCFAMHVRINRGLKVGFHYPS